MTSMIKPYYDEATRSCLALGTGVPLPALIDDAPPDIFDLYLIYDKLARETRVVKKRCAPVRVRASSPRGQPNLPTRVG